VSSSNFHNTNFTYSLDGSANISAQYNIPLSFEFNVQEAHSFQIWNRFGCNVIENITLPAATVPNTNALPVLTFDPSTMTLEASYYKLLYPSESGNVPVQDYSIDYRYSCPSSSSYSSWITVHNYDTTDAITVPFQYALEYDVRVYSSNCVGTSDLSDISTSIAPDSPYVPTILSITPQNALPTTGGFITVTGIYFSDTPSVYLDGIVTNTINESATSGVFQIEAGQGIHLISVRTAANFSCQEVTSTAVTWSYATPSITSTSVLSNVGGALQINGNNFGTFSANVSVTIDGTPCSLCSVTQEHQGINCSSCPAGSGTDHVLVVAVSGLYSTSYNFAYAVCDPMCIFGECVGNDVCECEAGYGGADCSATHICANDIQATAMLGDVCGACSDTSVCCQITSLRD